MPSAIPIDIRSEEALEILQSYTEELILHLDCSLPSLLLGNLYRGINRFICSPSITRKALHVGLNNLNLNSSHFSAQCNETYHKSNQLIVKSAGNSFNDPDLRLNKAVGDSIYPMPFPPFGFKEYFCISIESSSKYIQNPSVFLEYYISNDANLHSRLYFFKSRMVLCIRQGGGEVFRLYQSASGFDVTCDMNNSRDQDTVLRRAEDSFISETFIAGKKVFSYFDLSYGCLDFVYDNMFNAYAIDLNTTPWWGLDVDNHVDFLTSLFGAA